MSKLYHVYSLTDPFTFEIFYIGMTGGIKNRKRNHFTQSESHNPKLQLRILTIRADGANPTFKVLKTFEDKKTALSLERTLIKKLDPCCNIVGRRKEGENG